MRSRNNRPVFIQNGRKAPLHVVSLFYQVRYRVQVTAWSTKTMYSDVLECNCLLYRNKTTFGEVMTYGSRDATINWNDVEHQKLRAHGILLPPEIDVSGNLPVFAGITLHQLLAADGYDPDPKAHQWNYTFDWMFTTSGKWKPNSAIDQKIDLSAKIYGDCVEGVKDEPQYGSIKLEVDPPTSAQKLIWWAYLDYGWFSIPVHMASEDFRWFKPDNAVSFEAVFNKFKKLVGGEPNLFEPYGFDIFDRARDRALDDIRWLNINTAAYLRDLFQLGELRKSLREAIRKPMSEKVWRDVYMQYRYGLRLFIKDTEELITKGAAFNRQLTENARRNDLKVPKLMRGRGKQSSRETRNGLNVRCTSVVELWTEPFKGALAPLKELASLLVSADLWPGLHNLWDFVPYSFVLDWFIPVDDCLTELDKHLMYDALNISKVGVSLKASVTSQTIRFGPFWLSIEWSHYIRRLVPFNDFWLYFAMPEGLLAGFSNQKWSVIHTVDGIAMLRQRKRS